MNCSQPPTEATTSRAFRPVGFRLFCLVNLVAAAAVLCGCRAGTSVLGPPGTIYEQRSRAVLSDPFPNNELGPAVLGARPRGYETPLAQPVNVQASPYSELNKTNRGFVQRIFGRF